MSFKVVFQKFLIVLSVVLVLTLLIWLIRFSVREDAIRVCENVEMNIDRGSDGVYLQPHDIEFWLKQHGIGIQGRRLQEVSASNIESVIRQNPYVARVEVFPTQDGDYHLQVRQRSPRLKILNTRNELFQIDQEGVQIPVNLKYNTRIRVASGYIPYSPRFGESVFEIPDTEKRSVLRQIYELEGFLSSDSLWNALFEQIYVNSEGEIELVPKVGGQLIELGKLESKADLEDKMFRLRQFYRYAMGPESWQKYSKLSLKYSNQLVATRKPGM